MTKVAINGMGRIGRAAFKVILDPPELELVAVNDLMDLDNLAYLLKYDTVYGRYGKKVEIAKRPDSGRQKVSGPQRKRPGPTPLEQDLGVDVVFECTGFFTNKRA